MTIKTRQILAVHGMHCGSCERLIDVKVGTIDGVSLVEANVERGSVTVEYEPERSDLDRITQEITALGYEVTAVGTNGSADEGYAPAAACPVAPQEYKAPSQTEPERAPARCVSRKKGVLSWV